MEKLTELLGFEGQYLVYPLLALLGAGILRLITHRYLRRWADRTENKLDDQLVDYMDALIPPLALLLILYYVSHWLPESVAEAAGYIRQGLVIVIILLVMYLTARFAVSLLRVLAEGRPGIEKLMPPLRTLSYVMCILLGIALCLKALDISLAGQGARAIRIAGIVMGAFIVIRIVNLAVAQMERIVEDKDPTTQSEAEKRARTLGTIINNTALVLVIGVAIMMVMSEFGMDIMPIITGAGIAGLAVGFGAQNLVRDVISGFFLILEDQIRVGDVARINGTGGVVEALRLRTTTLRDVSGTVYIFPNGQINEVANLTKEFSYYVIDVGVAYKENVDDVMEVLKAIGGELEQDPAFAPYIMAPLEILGVDEFGDSQVTIKIRIKTLPLKQWLVGRELRRRIKNTFDSKGIEIPFPHVSIYMGEASKPFDLSMKTLGGQPGSGGIS